MINEEITDSSGRICSSNSAFTIQNQFSLLEEISSNGYNRLVKAMRYGKFFMLKGLKEKYRNDKTYIELLFKEFDILISMNHPNIVRAYSVEEVDDLGMCIVMDYIDGNILSEYLLSEPSSSNKRRIIKQLLKAMSYFHDMQCVHRDLKPSNILITNNGKNVKIIDFGLSDTDDYAVFKEPAFTRYYASPEQLEGGKLDCRSDIYSFGRILQQIFPYKYKKVVQKCTKTKREQRYSNAEEVYNALFSAKRFIVPATAIITIAVLLSFLVYNYIDYNSKVFNYTTPSGQVLKMQIVNSKAVILSNQKVSGNLIIPSKVKYRLRKFPVSEIASLAFYANTELKHVTFSDNLNIIGNNAFASCYKLTDTLVLPVNLEQIGYSAFASTDISCVVIESKDLHSLGRQDSMNYFHNTPKLKTVIIAPSVQNLCERLFEYSYEGLENVYFPDTLDEISSSFLAQTYSLRNVRFPKQINTIGMGAFFGTGMKRIVLPESLTVIADYAFRCVYDCHYMEIGKNVKIIGAAAFGTMDKLDTLVIRATTPPLTGTNAFQYTNERKITFLVPKESLELYRKDSVYRTLNPQPME